MGWLWVGSSEGCAGDGEGEVMDVFETFGRTTRCDETSREDARLSHVTDVDSTDASKLKTLERRR